MKLLDVAKTKYHGRNINEVEVPPELRVRIKTDIPFIDVALGGGAVPTSCWMVTGDPGVGKTTLMMTIADAFTAQNHVVLYNGREEIVYQMRMATERLGLKHGFIVGEDLFVGELVKHATKLQHQLAKENASLPVEKKRRVILIADSLQCLDSGKYDTGRKTKNTPVQCAQELIKWAKQSDVKNDKDKHYGILMFINHVTKAGHFAGDNTLLHAADARLTFGFDRNKKSVTYGERVLIKEKDRFGTAAPPMIVEMGVGGRLAEKIIEEPEDPEVEDNDVEDDAA